MVKAKLAFERTDEKSYEEPKVGYAYDNEYMAFQICKSLIFVLEFLYFSAQAVKESIFPGSLTQRPPYEFSEMTDYNSKISPSSPNNRSLLVDRKRDFIIPVQNALKLFDENYFNRKMVFINYDYIGEKFRKDFPDGHKYTVDNDYAFKSLFGQLSLIEALSKIQGYAGEVIRKYEDTVKTYTTPVDKIKKRIEWLYDAIIKLTVGVQEAIKNHESPEYAKMIAQMMASLAPGILRKKNKSHRRSSSRRSSSRRRRSNTRCRKL